MKIVDLTHPIRPQIPLWPGDPPVEVKPAATVEKDGYFLNLIRIGEQTGTHVGAPAHFYVGGKTVERFAGEDWVRPSVVIRVVGGCQKNADFALGVADVRRWEGRHGKVPAGCVVLMHTGWSARWNDERAYRNMDAKGAMHFPGFGEDAARLLCLERDVFGLGIDTLGIDCGEDQEFRANRVLFRGSRVHLENLTNLDKLPPKGATLVIAPLPIVGGSGSPARVFALLP